VGRSLKRSWLKSIGHYLGVSLFGPLFILSSLLLGSFLVTMHFFESTNVQSYSGLVVLLMGLLGFTFLYKFIPICRPSWQAAFLGSILVTLLVELLKFFFSLYLAWFPTYNLVYGAFSAIPIFLLWLFCLWIIVIFSASFVYQFDLDRKA